MNTEEMLTRLEGDGELRDELLLTFCEQIPEMLGELQSAAADGDIKRIIAAAHNLKGAASNICAEPTRHLAERIESMSKAGDVQQIDAALKDMQARLSELKHFIEAAQCQTSPITAASALHHTSP